MVVLRDSKGAALAVVADVGVDRGAQPPGRGEAGAGEGMALQEAEPDLDHVQPGGVVGVKWKWTFCGGRANGRTWACGG